jgi:hypothetical protein
MAENEFELLKSKVRSRSRRQGEEAAGAVQRRFAALGGLSGGAAIKAESQARQAATGAGEERLAQLEFAQAQQKGERAFRSGEALKGREFAGEQARIGREFGAEQAGIGRTFAAEQAREQRGFASREAGIGREFASREAGIGREFAAGEALKGREFTGSEAEKTRAIQREQFTQQMELANKQFRLEEDVANFNKEIARWQQGQPTDIFGQLLGPQFSTSGGIGGALLGGGAAGKIINPVGSIGGAICFEGDTFVTMAAAPDKKIKDMELGDETFGGQVTGVQSFLYTGEIYNYKGIRVTGDHAVFEDKWVRVKDAKMATKAGTFNGTVYCISTDGHRIYTDDAIFADFHEVDDYNVSSEDALKILNKEI